MRIKNIFFLGLTIFLGLGTKTFSMDIGEQLRQAQIKLEDLEKHIEEVKASNIGKHVKEKDKVAVGPLRREALKIRKKIQRLRRERGRLAKKEQIKKKKRDSAAGDIKRQNKRKFDQLMGDVNGLLEQLLTLAGRLRRLGDETGLLSKELEEVEKEFKIKDTSVIKELIRKLLQFIGQDRDKKISTHLRIYNGAKKLPGNNIEGAIGKLNGWKVELTELINENTRDLKEFQERYEQIKRMIEDLRRTGLEQRKEVNLLGREYAGLVKQVQELIKAKRALIGAIDEKCIAKLTVDLFGSLTPWLTKEIAEEIKNKIKIAIEQMENEKERLLREKRDKKKAIGKECNENTRKLKRSEQKVEQAEKKGFEAYRNTLNEEKVFLGEFIRLLRNNINDIKLFIDGNIAEINKKITRRIQRLIISITSKSEKDAQELSKFLKDYADLVREFEERLTTIDGLPDVIRRDCINPLQQFDIKRFSEDFENKVKGKRFKQNIKKIREDIQGCLKKKEGLIEEKNDEIIAIRKYALEKTRLLGGSKERADVSKMRASFEQKKKTLQKEIGLLKREIETLGRYINQKDIFIKKNIRDIEGLREELEKIVKRMQGLIEIKPKVQKPKPKKVKKVSKISGAVRRFNDFMEYFNLLMTELRSPNRRPSFYHVYLVNCNKFIDVILAYFEGGAAYKELRGLIDNARLKVVIDSLSRAFGALRTALGTLGSQVSAKKFDEATRAIEKAYSKISTPARIIFHGKNPLKARKEINAIKALIQGLEEFTGRKIIKK